MPPESGSEERVCRVAGYLSGPGVSGIFSSPSEDALKTSEILSRELGPADVQVEDALADMGPAPWVGMSEEEISLKHPEWFGIWNSPPARLKLEGREMLEELRKRALSAVKKIRKSAEPEGFHAPVAVTHASIIRTLFLHYNGLSLNWYGSVKVPGSSVFALVELAGKRTMQRVF